MTGKYFYFAVAALLAMLAAFTKFIPFALLTLLYVYGLSKYKGFTKQQLGFLIIMTLSFFVYGHLTDKTNHTVIPENTTTFTLKFSQDPKIDGDLLQVQAIEKTYNEKLLIRYKIKSEHEQAILKAQSFYGLACRVSGTMKPPQVAKNPNGFDYRRYLAAKEIYWVIESERNPLNHCIAVPTGDPIIYLKQLRLSGIHYLEKNFPPEIASLSAALIFGDRSMFDPMVLMNYQETGIVHLLAISGLHVSLLITMIFYLGIRIGLTRQFMTNFLLVLLPAYVVLTGGSPSVVRAAMMIYLVLLAEKWRNRIKLLPIDAISLAFLLCLSGNPLLLFDVGFQLSFSVSLAIILSVETLLKQYKTMIAAMLVTSIIAQMAALPFLLYHFFELSLIGIFANLLYIPLFSFVYLPGLYLLFFLQLLFGKTPLILKELFVIIITVFNKLIAAIAEIDSASFVPGRPNLLLLFIYIIIIFMIFFCWETKGVRYQKKLLIVLTICLFTAQPVLNRLNPYGEVTMIDVGQGDSLLIQLPYKRGTYLIDTGGTLVFEEEQWKRRANPFEVGRDVVVPFLKGKGITTIDKLILTHGDIDHIGGAFSVLKEIKVKEIMMPAVAESSQTEQAIFREAKKKSVPVVFVSEGDRWKKAGAEFYILAPQKNFSGERNSGSIAMVAQMGGLSWFFGGDLDQIGEEKIIKKYPYLTVDVLKAGHHGSRTSSAPSFIQRLNPKAALISVGQNNRYGHPHQEVVEILREENTAIYRTDTQGAITYKFYREKGTFLTFVP